MTQRASPIPLLTFATLAREGSFTRAAERLGLSQPAVTQHVQALQQHFGLRLVDVVGRRLELTEAGRFLAERCERVAESVATLEREMREYASLEQGELHLGATVTIGSYGIAAPIAEFRARHPRIALSVSVANTERVAAAVLRGELSLALVEGALDDPELEIMPYADDVLVVAAAPSHRLAQRRRPVRAAELAREPFVARERGSGTRALFEAAFRAAGIEPRVVLELPTGEGIVAAVEAGIGIAAVSSLVTRAAVAEGRISCIPVNDVDLRRQFRLVRLRHATPSPAARAFAESVLAIGSRTT